MLLKNIMEFPQGITENRNYIKQFLFFISVYYIHINNETNKNPISILKKIDPVFKFLVLK